jgi:hypothetical protein
MLTVLGDLAEFEREEAIERLRAGETQADIARTYGVDPTTIGRLDCTARANSSWA